MKEFSPLEVEGVKVTRRNLCNFIEKFVKDLNRVYRENRDFVIFLNSHNFTLKKVRKGGKEYYYIYVRYRSSSSKGFYIPVPDEIRGRELVVLLQHLKVIARYLVYTAAAV